MPSRICTNCFGSICASDREKDINVNGLIRSIGSVLKEKRDIDYLRGKVDIAVIGTQTIRIIENNGIGSVGGFIRGLR